MANVKGRRRRPKGAPDGGQFASENRGIRADDLKAPGFADADPHVPDPGDLKDTPRTRSALADLASECRRMTRRRKTRACNWAKSYDPQYLMGTVLGYADPKKAVALCAAVSNGRYNPDSDYVRYDARGNIESVDRETLEDEAAARRLHISYELRGHPEAWGGFPEDDLHALLDGAETDPTLLLDAAMTLNREYGVCEWADVHDSLNDLIELKNDRPEHDAVWLAERVQNGDFMDGGFPIGIPDSIGVDENGDLVAADTESTERRAWERRHEILQAVSRLRPDAPWIDECLSELETKGERE